MAIPRSGKGIERREDFLDGSSVIRYRISPTDGPQAPAQFIGAADQICPRLPQLECTVGQVGVIGKRRDLNEILSQAGSHFRSYVSIWAGVDSPLDTQYRVTRSRGQALLDCRMVANVERVPALFGSIIGSIEGQEHSGVRIVGMGFKPQRKQGLVGFTIVMPVMGSEAVEFDDQRMEPRILKSCRGTHQDISFKALHINLHEPRNSAVQGLVERCDGDIGRGNRWIIIGAENVIRRARTGGESQCSRFPSKSLS